MQMRVYLGCHQCRMVSNEYGRIRRGPSGVTGMKALWEILVKFQPSDNEKFQNIHMPHGKQ
jgi:hypothetical protein